jgi:hypothetical protein
MAKNKVRKDHKKQKAQFSTSGTGVCDNNGAMQSTPPEPQQPIEYSIKLNDSKSPQKKLSFRAMGSDVMSTAKINTEDWPSDDEASTENASNHLFVARPGERKTSIFTKQIDVNDWPSSDDELDNAAQLQQNENLHDDIEED